MIETTEERGLPIWLSLLIILLALGAGGGLLVWMFGGASASTEVVVAPPTSFDASAPAPTRRRFVPQPAQPTQANNDIISISATEWRANSGNADMRVSIVDGNPVVRCTYRAWDFIPPEQFRLNMLARNIVDNDATARQAKVTPEQLEKLKPLSPRVGMRISEENRKALVELFKQFLAAPDAEKPAIKANILEKLKAAGDAALPSTKSAIEQRAATVKTILSEEQLKELLGK